MSVFVIRKIKETNKSTLVCMGEIYRVLCPEPLPSGNRTPLLPGLGTAPSPLRMGGGGPPPTPRAQELTSDPGWANESFPESVPNGCGDRKCCLPKQLLAAAPIRVRLRFHQRPENGNFEEMAVHPVRQLQCYFSARPSPSPPPTRCLLKAPYCRHPPLST